MVTHSVSWLGSLFVWEDKAMRLVIVSSVLLLAVVLVIALYCCLVLAKRADDEMKNILDADQCKKRKGR